MGHSNKRKGRDGKPRYTAIYEDIRGRRRSAGTYGSRKEAEKAWQAAEAKARESQTTPVRRGPLRFEPYVRDTWFPNHRLELRSRETYSYYLEKRIIPYFGPMRMIEIGSQDVREFVTKLVNDGVKASSVAYCLDTVLSAIFKTALNDQIVQLHPCKGVEGPTVAKKIRAIITPEQFDKLHETLGDELWQLLVETDIETGLRIGEALGLDRDDVNLDELVLAVTGKNGHSRLVPLHPAAAATLRAYAARRDELCPWTSAAFFTTRSGRRMRQREVQEIFARLLAMAEITAPPGCRRPRIHDLRHTFTVETVAGWYRDGADVPAMMPVLSAFLGHSSPEVTYWYLEAVPALLSQAAARLEDARTGRETAP
jgi:integrase